MQEAEITYKKRRGKIKQNDENEKGKQKIHERKGPNKQEAAALKVLPVSYRL